MASNQVGDKGSRRRRGGKKKQQKVSALPEQILQPQSQKQPMQQQKSLQNCTQEQQQLENIKQQSAKDNGSFETTSGFGKTEHEPGRNIIYLTNRAKLAAQAEILADAVPFRLPYTTSN